MVVYPLPQFPGRTQEHILQQLLRTKLEPEVDDWVERGQEITQKSPTESSYRLSNNDLDELWEWAPQDATKEGMKQKWGADYTLAEIQMGVDKVKTGLERELKVPEDDDNEEDNGVGDKLGDNEHDTVLIERMTSDVAEALIAKFGEVTEARVKVEKPEPEGLNATAEAVELTLARGPRPSPKAPR